MNSLDILAKSNLDPNSTQYKQIKNELELLQLLKPLVKYTINHNSYTLPIEAYHKIKLWLTTEKNIAG